MKRIFISLSFIFITQNVWADFTCDTDISRYYAFYKINEYTCSSGEFLPADSLGCVSCPNGSICPGGTYKYNTDYFQGLDLDNISSVTMNDVCANNFPQRLIAIYKPNQYTCSPGYYLPAGNDWLTDTEGCRLCPLNHYCIGGTYTFNETTDQGIESCNGTFAPTGNSFCYEHKLHVGNEALYLRASKRTTPSLNIGLNDDVYYANMTTIPTYMTSGSTHYFKTIYNEQTYYICDDTTYGVEE